MYIILAGREKRDDLKLSNGPLIPNKFLTNKKTKQKNLELRTHVASFANTLALAPITLCFFVTSFIMDYSQNACFYYSSRRAAVSSEYS